MQSLLIKRKNVGKYFFKNKHTFVNTIYNADKFNKLQNEEYKGKTEYFHLNQNYL